MSTQASHLRLLMRISRANPLATMLASLVVIGGVMTAHLLLTRVQNGRLPLIVFPFDTSLRVIEQGDARQTAEEYYGISRLAAMIGLLLTVVLISRVNLRAELTPMLRSKWFWILLLAMLADLMTTVWFMHSRGIERELHPGLRLLAYAFGRSAGPVMGKGIQFCGIVLFGMQSHRWWPWLAGLSASLAMLAALHNSLQML